MIFQDALSKAYASSSEIFADEKSRFVIFSDCHRSDGSLADDFVPNRGTFLRALESYYNKDYTYIELGDGDELWETERFSDIMLENESVFSLLSRFYSEGRLYFLYGNHDIVRRIPKPDKNPYLLNNEFTELFPCVDFRESLKIDYKGNKIFLIHGHQADFFNSVLWRLSRLLVRDLWKRLEMLGFSDPTSASKNLRKKNAVEMKLSNWANENGVMLIAGHTHRALFPKPGDGLYFNDGCCVNRDHISAIEIESGVISLVNWRMNASSDGASYAEREPVSRANIEDYFI